MNEAIRINKYMPIAILYFFFNSFLLPQGLLYTTLLTPFFLLWLVKFPSAKYIWLFFIFIIPFAVIHFINGVNQEYYARSLLLFFTVYVFCLAFNQFLKICKSLRSIYRNILTINFFLFILAIIALFIPALQRIFWSNSAITHGVEGVKRLQMFTYEPSYYSTLLATIALYYYLKAIMGKLPNPYTALIFLTLPLALSLSFGVILSLFLALVLTLFTNISYFFFRKKIALYIMITIVILITALLLLFIFNPHNIIFIRISNIFEGNDTSFKGRTYDAFYLGWHVAEQKTVWFGCGLGQTKELGLALYRNYYKSKNFTVDDVAIPNAVGETLAIFGIIGLFIRFFLEVYFFFKTKVYSNYYRLSLFIYIFLYQFTGSYIMNIAEYVIWILAFNKDIFGEFDRSIKENRAGKSENYYMPASG